MNSLNTPAKSEVWNPKQDQELTLPIFFISKKFIRLVLEKANIPKPKGTEAIPHGCYQKVSEPRRHALHLIFEAIKRTKTIPDEWRVGAVMPIYKEEDEFVENYRPVTLLNILSKKLERCTYEPLYELFVNHVTNFQQGFITGRSVLTYMLRYLHYVHGTGKDTKTATIVFYADFAKTLVKVPQCNLFKKLAVLGDDHDDCFLRKLEKYLKDRKHVVRKGSIRLSTMNITSGLQQESIIEPLLFCFF